MANKYWYKPIYIKSSGNKKIRLKTAYYFVYLRLKKR